MEKRSPIPRVRMNTQVKPETRASVKRLNSENVARSEGAVVDLAVETLVEVRAAAAKKGDS